MGTVSRDAVEPWAGNAGFTERGGMDHFTGC